MGWYANKTASPIQLKQAASSPGGDWVLIQGAPDSDTQGQALQQLVDDVANGDYGSSFSNLGGAVATTLGIGNPFTSVEDALTKIWAKLSDGKMWRSLGWLLLGILLMIAGVALLLKRSVTTEIGSIAKAAA